MSAEHKVTIRLRYTELGTPWKWVGTCLCGWRCMSWLWACDENPERGALPMSLEHMTHVTRALRVARTSRDE